MTASSAPPARLSLPLDRNLRRSAGADLARPPWDAEVERGLRLIESLQREERLSADAALKAYCLLVLNLNEFVYLD